MNNDVHYRLHIGSPGRSRLYLHGSGIFVPNCVLIKSELRATAVIAGILTSCSTLCGLYQPFEFVQVAYIRVPNAARNIFYGMITAAELFVFFLSSSDAWFSLFAMSLRGSRFSPHTGLLIVVILSGRQRV